MSVVSNSCIRSQYWDSSSSVSSNAVYIRGGLSWRLLCVVDLEKVDHVTGASTHVYLLKHDYHVCVYVKMQLRYIMILTFSFNIV